MGRPPEAALAGYSDGVGSMAGTAAPSLAGAGSAAARGAHADVVASPGQAHIPGGGADFRGAGLVQPDVTRGGLRLEVAGDPGRGDVAAGRMRVQGSQLTVADDVGGRGPRHAARA